MPWSLGDSLQVSSSGPVFETIGEHEHWYGVMAIEGKQVQETLNPSLHPQRRRS